MHGLALGLKKGVEAVDGVQLLGSGTFCGVLESVGQEVDGMEDAVFISDSGLGEVVVAELYSFRVEQRLGGGVDNMEVAVVLKCGPDVEAVAATEVLGAAGTF